jgi:hypothetical protein
MAGLSKALVLAVDRHGFKTKVSHDAGILIKSEASLVSLFGKGQEICGWGGPSNPGMGFKTV